MIRPWRSARSKGTAETRPRRHRRRGEGKFKRGSEHAGKSAQRYRQREILQTLLIRSATSFDELVAQPFPLKVAFLSRLVETNDVGRVAICAIPPERENRGLPAKTGVVGKKLTPKIRLICSLNWFMNMFMNRS